MFARKERGRPSLRTVVTRRILDIPRTGWEAIFPDVVESYDFFRTLDESDLPQFSFYYISVYQKKALVGATACFLVDYSLDTSINGPLRRVTNSIKKLKPDIFSIKTLICGFPMGQGRIGIKGDDPDPAHIIEVITRRMDRLARKLKVSLVALKDFNETYRPMLDPLRKSGFARFDSLPTTELDIAFPDFEAYLKTLSSASRYDLRRKFKRSEKEGGISFELVKKLDETTLDDIYRLYLQIVEKHDMGFELLPKSFFRNIEKNMPDAAKFFIWRVNGKVGAFLFALVSKELFIDYYVGLDYEVAHDYHLYFVKFRDTLNWCIEHNIPKYEMGITGYEPKRRLGFSFIPLYLYVKLRNRALRPVFNLVCQFLKFENFDPSLKLAKKELQKK